MYEKDFNDYLMRVFENFSFYNNGDRIPIKEYTLYYQIVLTYLSTHDSIN